MAERGSGFRADEIKPLIGARVTCEKDVLLRGDHAGELRELLEKRGVLVFPKVDFTEDEQVAFTKTLGTFAPDGAPDKATVISMDPGVSPSAKLIRGAQFWHFDGYMNDVPVLASIMCGKVLAATGGDTQFANTYAAYEALPDEWKEQLEGLRVVHAIAAAQMSVEPEPSHAEFSDWLKIPSNTLPLVWTHRTGRKSLVLGNSAAGIVGMDPLQSLELLVWLRDWATQERFTYSHEWSVGDAVIWDNTGTLHRATPYTAESGRLMFRTKLAGEEPFN